MSFADQFSIFKSSKSEFESFSFNTTQRFGAESQPKDAAGTELYGRQLEEAPEEERLEKQVCPSQHLAASSPGVEEDIQDIEKEIGNSPADDPPSLPDDASNEIKPGRTGIYRKGATKVGNGGDPKPQVALVYSEMERGNDNLNIFAQLVC